MNLRRPGHGRPGTHSCHDIPRIAADRLTDLTAAVFAAVGVPDPDAHLIAGSLARADLWGHQSHGVMRPGWYVDGIRAGVIRAKTRSELIVDAGAVAVLDGLDGVGQLLTAPATRVDDGRHGARGGYDHERGRPGDTVTSRASPAPTGTASGPTDEVAEGTRSDRADEEPAGP
jgi:hypothetical protein